MLSAAFFIGFLLIFINKILFAIEALMCRAIDVLYDMFDVFAGIKTITFEGEKTYLLEYFFNDDVISTVYVGMACIGMALTFIFALGAVIRKMFDSSGERVKATYGMILTNVFKAILLICLMTAIVSATIQASGVLMRSISDLMDNARKIAHPDTIEFTDEDRGTMYRVLVTVANYTLNPSYENRYNVNSCFNAIRSDMQLLAKRGVFNFTYIGKEGSWQYALRQIYMAGDIKYAVPIDIYDEKLSDAILYCATQIKNNAGFVPIESFTKESATDSIGTLGRVVMVSGSMRAARNSSYNENSTVDDGLRAPYYYGTKNAYSYDDMDEDFDISLDCWDHLMIIVVAYFLIKELAKLIINCVARIFNIILLYITAPGFIAVMPLDDGGKFKQWTTAFVIQSLSIFGSLIAVRLMVMFIPMVMSSSLVLFENSFQNVVAKLLLVVGICVTAEKASGMISGILADNAGYQSIMAGDVGGGVVARGLSLASRVGGGAARLGFKAGTGIMGAAGTALGLTTAKDKLTKGLSNLGQAMRDRGGIVGAHKHGWETSEAEGKRREQEVRDADREDTKSFRSQMMDNFSGSKGPDGGEPYGGGNPKDFGDRNPGPKDMGGPPDNGEPKDNSGFGERGFDPKNNGSHGGGDSEDKGSKGGHNPPSGNPFAEPNRKPPVMPPPKDDKRESGVDIRNYGKK